MSVSVCLKVYVIITKYGSFTLLQRSARATAKCGGNLLQSRQSLLQSRALYYKVGQILQGRAVIRQKSKSKIQS